MPLIETIIKALIKYYDFFNLGICIQKIIWFDTMIKNEVVNWFPSTAKYVMCYCPYFVHNIYYQVVKIIFRYKQVNLSTRLTN